ncbi:DUF2281 domain-containing protein [candidate division KSB1 bacterium]|nr:DUF2281 domain-containing protein [candidate division KSB1 bacterium]
MDIKTLIEDFKILPEPAQKELVDFMAFLKLRYTKPSKPAESLKTQLLEEPFLGMWKNRADLKDSTAWIRSIRKKEWDLNG